MPIDSVERNIKKASSSDTQDYVEVVYELYGYGGVGLIVEAMTDNKNRAASDIRVAINKRGGTLATPGAVSYNFDRRGVIRVTKTSMKEAALFLLATDSGAEDLIVEDDAYLVITPVDVFCALKAAIAQAGGQCEEAELAMRPKGWVEVTEEQADQNMALIEWLENINDVDAVYHNMQL